MKNKIHPTSVISGYRLAMREAVRYIKDNLTVPVDTLGRQNLINCAKVRNFKPNDIHVQISPKNPPPPPPSPQTTISSKILGTESEFFAGLAVDAVTSIRTESSKGGKTVARYPVHAINILKSHGKSSTEVGVLRSPCFHFYNWLLCAANSCPCGRLCPLCLVHRV